MTEKCYAKKLENCSGGISREHYISDSILREFSGLTVSGFSWAKTPKEVGPGSLTAKILCSTHNSALTDLDREALKAFKAFKEVSNVSRVSFKNEKFNLDGKKFEKWVLKVLCGYVASGNAQLSNGLKVNPELSISWIKTLFALEEFPVGCGLYIKAAVRDKIETGDKVQLACVTKPATEIVTGLLFNFRGFEFALVLDESFKPGDNFLLRVQKIHINNPKSKCTIHFHYHSA